MSDPRSDELMARFRREAEAALGGWEFDRALRQQVRRKLAAAGTPGAEGGLPAPGLRARSRWLWALGGFAAAAAVAFAVVRPGGPGSRSLAPPGAPQGASVASQAGQASGGSTSASAPAPAVAHEGAAALRARREPVPGAAPSTPQAATRSDSVPQGSASAQAAPQDAVKQDAGNVGKGEDPGPPEGGAGIAAAGRSTGESAPEAAWGQEKGVAVRYAAALLVPEVTTPARQPAVIEVTLRAVTDLPALTVSGEVKTPAGAAALPELHVARGLASGAEQRLHLRWNGKLPGDPETWAPPGEYPVTVRVYVKSAVISGAESVVRVKPPPPP